MRFVLDLPPNVASARMHWRTRNRRRDLYYEACDNRQLLGLVPPPGDPIQRCAITALFQLHNLQDWDNLYARLKFAFDWLVTRGYLEDDGPAVIPECPRVSQVINRKKKRLVLEIEEL